MSLGLLLPAGLAALAALLLPLLIHLARHSEQRLTDFAALRWLSVQLRPRQKLRFEEWLLLALRLALLVVLALLLARPVLFGGMGNAPWVAVVPGVDRAAARAAVSLDDAQWHWLAPGFPDFTDTPPQAALPISSLLRELDAQLPTRTPITIIAPEQIGGLDGALPMLSRAIDWRVSPGACLQRRRHPRRPHRRWWFVLPRTANPTCAICVRQMRRGVSPTSLPRMIEAPARPRCNRHRPIAHCRRKRAGWCGWFLARCRPPFTTGSRAAASRCSMRRPSFHEFPMASRFGATTAARRWYAASRSATAARCN